VKRLAATLLLGTILTACGGDDSGSLSERQGLEGLWDANSFSIAGIGSGPVDSGEAYIFIEDTSQNPFEANFYSLTEQNCLELEAELITDVGNRKYQDESGEVATFIADGNELTMTVTEEELSVSLTMERVTGLSVTDLPVCTTQSNTAENNFFNDDSDNNSTKQFFESFRQFVKSNL